MVSILTAGQRQHFHFKTCLASPIMRTNTGNLLVQ
jgi:hypothetical protein